MSAVFSELENLAQQENIPIISRAAGQFLAQLVLLKRPVRILELGTAIGYSALWLNSVYQAELLRTVDVSAPNLARARQVLTAPNVEIVQSEIKKFLEADRTIYDFIFVDATKSEYGQYLELSLPRLANGGVIVFDNMQNCTRTKKNKELSEFREIFLANAELLTSLLPIGDGLGLGVKK